MKKEERMFKNMQDFLAGMATLDPEVYATELKKFSSSEQENISCTEYIAANSYPAKKINMNIIKLSLKLDGKIYYPIVGWNPDAANPNSNGTIPAYRKWMNKLPQRRLHNSKENRTYILYA